MLKARQLLIFSCITTWGTLCSPCKLRATQTSQTIEERERKQIHELILKKMGEQDKEFEDFATLEQALSDGQIEEFKQKLEDFKKNYLLSAYQSFFPLLQDFCTYKLESAEPTALASTERFQLPPEVLAYGNYLHGLKLKEYSELHPLFHKLPFTPPDYTLYSDFTYAAAQTFYELLKNYPKVNYGRDVEQRLHALERRYALGRLQQVLELYQSAHYVAAIQQAFAMIEQQPYRIESIQALLVIEKSYEALHLPELTKPIRAIYLLNRHKLWPLSSSNTLKSWIDLAKSTDFALPKPSDEPLYRVSKSLLLPLYRFEVNLQQDAPVKEQFEYFSEEEKKINKMVKVKEAVTTWVELHQQWQQSPQANDPGWQKAFAKFEALCHELGATLQGRPFKELKRFDFEQAAQNLREALKPLQTLVGGKAQEPQAPKASELD